MTISILTHSLR